MKFETIAALATALTDWKDAGRNSLDVALCIATMVQEAVDGRTPPIYGSLSSTIAGPGGIGESSRSPPSGTEKDTE